MIEKYSNKLKVFVVVKHFFFWMEKQLFLKIVLTFFENYFYSLNLV